MSSSVNEKGGMAIGHLLSATLAAAVVKQGDPRWLQLPTDGCERARLLLSDAV
jgi:hypothetical protein